MRKLLMVMFVAFTASVFALAGSAQRRARAGRTGRGSSAVPVSPQIAQELGAVRWGMSHDQVVDYFRQAVTARYAPQLRNKGQVEQDRLMQDRDHEIQLVRDSYIQFNGAQNQRRWDTSFVGSEYTHNNNESMLVYEDPANGNREFFFFFNDRLWKRFQARSVPAGSGLDFNGFVVRVEQLFGPGLHVPDPDRPDHLTTVVWQDDATRLHVVDNSTFFNSFCLIYEDKGTLSRLAELRHGAPTKNDNGHNAHPGLEEPQVGNVEGDSNADIVDRITGKMRHTSDGPAVPAPSTTTTTTTTTTTPTPAAHPTQPGDDTDPLRGL